MGLELIIGAVSAITGIVGGVTQAGAAKRAANAQKEANNIQAAQTQVQSTESRRQKIREQRIRRAQIIAASENAGTTASSGQVGAVGALSTNLAGLVGSSLGESRANAGINKFNQKSADATAQSNMIGAWTNTIQSGLSGFQTIFDQPK